MDAILKNINSEQHCDIAIVGGGPAGALAAFLAARAGFSVVILEKKHLERPKICGGFVSARALELLPKTLLAATATASPVHTIRVIKGRHTYTYTPDTKPGLLVKRDAFDALLLKEARQPGARLFEKCPLKSLEELSPKQANHFCYRLKVGNSDTRPIVARYIIGADGALGKTACLAGLRPAKPSFCGRAVAALSPAAGNSAAAGTLTFFPLPLAGGMGWSFAGHGWHNRGVGSLAGYKKLRRHYNRLFGYPAKPGALFFWPLPFFGPLQKAGRANILLVGDAAGLVEPYSGEGLFNAFLSAHLAVQAIKEAQKTKSAAGLLYQLSFNQYFRKNFFAVLARAAWLTALTTTAAAKLPAALAALMKNDYFNLQKERNEPADKLFADKQS